MVKTTAEFIYRYRSGRINLVNKAKDQPVGFLMLQFKARCTDPQDRFYLHDISFAVVQFRDGDDMHSGNAFLTSTSIFSSVSSFFTTKLVNSRSAAKPHKGRRRIAVASTLNNNPTGHGQTHQACCQQQNSFSLGDRMVIINYREDYRSIDWAALRESVTLGVIMNRIAG